MALVRSMLLMLAVCLAAVTSYPTSTLPPEAWWIAMARRSTQYPQEGIYRPPTHGPPPLRGGERVDTPPVLEPEQKPQQDPQEPQQEPQQPVDPGQRHDGYERQSTQGPPQPTERSESTKRPTDPTEPTEPTKKQTDPEPIFKTEGPFSEPARDPTGPTEPTRKPNEPTAGPTDPTTQKPTATPRPTTETTTNTPQKQSTTSKDFHERILNFTGNGNELPNMVIHDHIANGETDVDPKAEVESRLYILNDLELQLEEMERTQGDDYYVKLAFSKELLDRALNKMSNIRNRLADWEEETNRPHSRKRRTSYFVSSLGTNALSDSASLQVHLLRFRQQDFCDDNCMYNVTWYEVNNPSDVSTVNVTWGREGGIYTITGLKFFTYYMVQSCIMNQPAVNRINDFYCNTRRARTNARPGDGRVNDFIDNGLPPLPFEGFEDQPGAQAVGSSTNNNNNNQNANNNNNQNANNNNQNTNNNQNANNNQNTNQNGQQSNANSNNNNNNDYWQWCPTDRCTCGCS